jgi:hypothetical protein
MTKLRYTHQPRWRESEVMVRDPDARLLIVAFEPSALLLRRKGTRQVLRIPLTIAYDVAARLEADRLRAERKARRKNRGGLRNAAR